MNRRSTYALLILSLLIVALACTSTRAPGTPPAPAERFVTLTSVPTVTPFRSQTPTITATKSPTQSATPDETDTPTPTSTPTPNPSFWRP